MEHLKKVTLTAFALILIVALGAAGPAAAGCSSLCNGTFCESEPEHPQWGCTQGAGTCYDEQCWAPQFAAGEVEAITAAAAAGDLALAQKLAKDHPTLRIFKAGSLIFNGPQLAGIPGPEATPAAAGEIRVACASLHAAPTAAPAAEPAASAEP